MKKYLSISLLAALFVCATAFADETIYSEQHKLVRSGSSVTTLGTDLFGDKVNLYNGSIEFVQTDVSLPGNNALPVSVGRRFVPGQGFLVSGIFGDWDLDIPHMHGVFSGGGFTPNYPWTVVGLDIGQTYQRCTRFGVPPNVNSLQTAATWAFSEYWHGNFLYVPGQGSQEVIRRSTTNLNYPSATDSLPDVNGKVWPLTTATQWSIRCLGTLARGTGEGFLAVSPDGTQYQFDWLVTRPYDSLSKVSPAPVIGLAGGTAPAASAVDGTNSNSPAANSTASGTGSTLKGGGVVTPNVAQDNNMSRQEVWILPTVITDRFGNKVTYTYDATNPWRLQTIVETNPAKEVGRSISLTYDASGRVSTVSNSTAPLSGYSDVADPNRPKTWTYSYSATGLTGISLPDGSSWSFNGMDSMKSSADIYLGPPVCEEEGYLNTYEPSLTITHPSGAQGTFRTRPVSHSRSFVEQSCRGSVAEGTSYAYYPKYISNYSLINKVIAGANLPTMTWSYAYSPAANTGSWSTCTGSCPDTKFVEVTDPNNNLTRYTFGNKFRVTEGQLQKIEVGPVTGGILRSTTMAYQAPDAGPYPNPIGTSPQPRGNGDLAARHAPMNQRIISQQGVNFTWSGSNFDAKARPLTVVRTGNGVSRTETTAYMDNDAANSINSSKWILGQVKSVTDSGGKVMVLNTYDPATANLLTTSYFGKLIQTLTYNADGTVSTRKDGLNQTVTLSNYKRGVAQNVQYADASTESAQVNNFGGIDWIIDPNSYKTEFKYDAAGRLNQIIYPTLDTTAWNQTTLTFEPVASVEHGMLAGHWRQTVSTGNARTITYYDALWRPRLTKTFDATNEAATRNMIERRFDGNSRTVFESYPRSSIDLLMDVTTGVATTYDALGRVTSFVANSELGPLTTTTSYDAPFKATQTNPRGFTTTTTFQALDDPADALISTVNAVSSISPPESINLTITRDTFRKPITVTRTNVGGTAVAATRYYKYNSAELLCKTVEPETGATLQDYDAANNVTWRASGLAFTDATACAADTVAAASKVTFGYDTRNRLTSTNFGNGSAGITRTYWPDGLPKTVSSNGAVWTSNYNKRRLLVNETLVYAGQTYPLSWAYNANGHPSQLTYPDTKVVTMSPNALGQSTQIKQADRTDIFASSISYFPNGAVAGFTYGNGITRSLTQNTRGLPLAAIDGAMLKDTYTYDANANVAGIADATTSGMSRTMSYDGLDRLKTTAAPGMWNNATYTYDALDNIRTSVIGTTSNTHNYDAAKNRLSSITTSISGGAATTTSYAYDIQGNITTKGAQGFSFDQGNRMLSATGKANYVYDGLGHRVLSTSSDGTQTVSVYSPAGMLLYTQQTGGPNPPRKTKYVYLNRHLIAEVAQ